MGQVQALRPVHSLVSIPVEQAIYCRHCKTVSNSLRERCGKCGSELVLHLATLVDQPPAGPDSGPAAAVRIVPAFDLELARAA
jgi:hypothetical protein